MLRSPMVEPGEICQSKLSLDVMDDACFKFVFHFRILSTCLLAGVVSRKIGTPLTISLPPEICRTNVDASLSEAYSTTESVEKSHWHERQGCTDALEPFTMLPANLFWGPARWVRVSQGIRVQFHDIVSLSSE